ncbi:MAG: TolC family outer membrane protein [Croceibacterium sp.]
MTARGLRILLLASACASATPLFAQESPDGVVDTLQEALSRAYQSNPTILGARATLRASDENVPIKRADELPSLSLAPTYTEFLKQSSSSLTAPARSLSGQLSLTVPVYAGGANRNSLKAAETRVLAGREDLRGTESSVFSQVVAAYMDVIQNEAIVGLTTNNVQVLSVNLQATGDRFEIGDLTRTDVAQSQARQALAQSDLRTAQSNLIRAKENFIALVGSAPDDLQPPPPLPGLPADVQRAVQIALAENPDLAGALERADATRYDIAIAGAGRLPRVDVFTSGGATNFLGTISSTIPGVSLEQMQTTAQAGVRATIPLYQGGRPAAQQRQAQERSSAALEQVVFEERSLISQVRSAYASWRASTEIIASNQTAVQAAELSLEGVRAENTVGNRTILDILDAQQELLRAQVQLVTARRNSYVAGFTLLAAMGRAEARDLGLEAYGPLYDPVVNYERVKRIAWDWQRDPDPVTQASRTVDIAPQDANIPPVQGPGASSAALPRSE